VEQTNNSSRRLNMNSVHNELTYRKQLPRVAFIAHGLLPGYFSSIRIESFLQKAKLANWQVYRKAELGKGPPKAFKWLSFPVVAPAGSGAQDIWVDFYIINRYAPEFLAAVKTGEAYQWCKSTALYAIDEAQRDGVPITIGWGAATKNATNHGKKFLDDHPGLLLCPDVSTTHGDGGTTGLAIEALGNVNIRAGESRVAIIGANGCIGDAISQAIAQHFSPREIVLVGKPDHPGKIDKLERLITLRKQVEAAALAAGKTGIRVVTEQDKSCACLDHHTDVVVVATTGMELLPEEIPNGAVVVDLTTPSACNPNHDWSGRTVILGGCGQLNNSDMLPNGFSSFVDGSPTWRNVGAAVTEDGGDGVLWGCTWDTVARAMYGCTGHIAGPKVEMAQVQESLDQFKRLGIDPQPPMTFGQPNDWREISANHKLEREKVVA